jgi:hypothetical protein
VPTLVTAAPANAAVPDFRIGLRLIDNGGRSEEGRLQVTKSVAEGGSAVFASDANNFDPDGAQLALLTTTGIPTNLDFRICAQAIDVPRPSDTQFGPVSCSPWAGDGGGSTGLVTDTDFFDPDGYQISLQVRPLPAGVQITDLLLFIQAFDFGDRNRGFVGPQQFTPALSQGGGFSPYAFDPNFFDPDGFIFGIAPGRILG